MAERGTRGRTQTQDRGTRRQAGGGGKRIDRRVRSGRTGGIKADRGARRQTDDLGGKGPQCGLGE